jgi:hypothetical protein
MPILAIELDTSEISTVNEQHFFELYSEVMQKPIPVARLDIGKTKEGQQFRGMRFYVCGNFTTLPSVKHTDKNGVTSKGKVKVTKVNLLQYVEELGGCVISDSAFESISLKNYELRNCYFVLQDANQFEQLKRRQSVGSKAQTGETITVSKKFETSTSGKWTYILGQYIVDSHVEKELLDPASYVIIADQRNFVKSAVMPTTRHMERQRKPGVRNIKVKLSFQHIK